MAMTKGSRETILVVEDDEGVALLERRALERRGYAVTSVGTAPAAIAAITRDSIDLVVMDYRLPDGSTGLDLFDQIKSLGYQIPVIMVTGFSNESVAIDALRQGVRDFVPKSFAYLDYLPEAVQRILGTVHTERKLAASETRFQLFMDNSPAIAFLKDAEGRLLYANRRFRDECQSPNVLGKTNAELWPEDTARMLQECDAAVVTGNASRSSTDLLTRPDGTVRHWLTCRFPLQDNGEALVGGMAVDVTEQHLAEESLRLRDEQLRQSQKMEAVGQLAGGVAHDFNNLLTIIMSFTELLRDETVQGTEQHVLLGEVYRAAERAALLTRQLLTFSRREVVESRPVNLNDCVSLMEKMLRRLIGEDIQIDTRLDSSLQAVSADHGQMEQVVMNLAVNARDAMPNGGTVRIETSNVELEATHTLSCGDVKPGRYVMLTVTDTGCGMDEATQKRIFEPFFTTKGPGKGTGLGLATVYGIVNQNQGHLRVSSQVGRGTTFHVYLPALETTTSAQDAIGTAGSVKGHETVLLVEDERSVRELCGHALRLHGYTVLEAGDPFEALSLSHAHEGCIELLLTDVVMPNLNGRQLAELILVERPGIRVLYVSGYTDDETVRRGVVKNQMALLPKPFTPKALVAKVRDVLDQWLAPVPADCRGGRPAKTATSAQAVGLLRE